MPKKSSPRTKQIVNRRARFDYDLADDMVVGLQLTGRETKALRMGHGHLRGSYVTVKDSANGGELWLLNATITGAKGIPIDEEEQTRSRKILAKRKEINSLITNKQQGNAIIPTKLLTEGRYIKLVIATGRGKKRFDKREVMKKREEKRDIGRMLKNHK